MTRIGLVADTHHPEFMPRLPAELLEALAGVDLILHAGDVGGHETIEQLSRIAPVEAVRGDHDPSLALPFSRTLEIEGRVITVVHGNRSRLVEEPITLMGTLTLGLAWPTPGIAGWLRRRFPAADVIVYGHTHQADASTTGGALVINPGAVYVVTPSEARRRLEGEPGWFEWSWLQVIRHRRRWPAPSVGILEVAEAGLLVTFVPLPRPSD